MHLFGLFRDRAVEEGDDLGAGAVVVRTEGTVRIAGGDAGLGRPEDCLIIILVRVRDVRERALLRCGLRAAAGAPEERDDMRARAALIGIPAAKDIALSCRAPKRTRRKRRSAPRELCRGRWC